MTHAQWLAKIRESLATVEDSPERALASFKRLLTRLQKEASKTLGEWHIGQTLEALSIVESHLGEHRRSAETILRVADHYEQELAYARRAVVSACATAALELAAVGEKTAARRALERAKPLAMGLRPPEKLFRHAVRVVAARFRRRSAARSQPLAKTRPHPKGCGRSK